MSVSFSGIQEADCAACFARWGVPSVFGRVCISLPHTLYTNMHTYVALRVCACVQNVTG